MLCHANPAGVRASLSRVAAAAGAASQHYPSPVLQAAHLLPSTGCPPAHAGDVGAAVRGGDVVAPPVLSGTYTETDMICGQAWHCGFFLFLSFQILTWAFSSAEMRIHEVDGQIGRCSVSVTRYRSGVGGGVLQWATDGLQVGVPVRPWLRPNLPARTADGPLCSGPVGATT